MIITIDGPVGTGKSTIAQKAADALGFQYFDTGAMYRCLTYGILKHHTTELPLFLNQFTFEIQLTHGEKRYLYEGEDITDNIRQEKVTANVSQVSAIPEVREKLVDLQRNLSQGIDAVFEGRDMGTVVFPQAELKIYLTASPEVRAERRYQELLTKFPDQHTSYESILKQVRERDERDTTRRHSPLREAEDSFILDSTHLSINDVLEQILLLYNRRINRHNV